MLQAQFITIALLAPSGVADPDRAIAEAAQHQRDFGEPAAKQALARYGFFPFAYGRFSDRREAADRGLTHCAAIRGDAAWFCARLSARIVDRSPVHLRVEALPGFRLMAAHYVEADGRVRRLLPDAEAIFDLPSAPTSVAIGVTVKGSEGPETGLYIPLRSDHFVPDPCQEGGQLDALRSSPLSVGEYLLAYGLMGCELSLVVVLSCAGILTGGHVPWWLIPAAWVALVPSAALLTLCLCVVARSQMTAMWVLRVAFPLALLPVLVGVLFGVSGQFWLQPLTMFWGGQAMFAALEGQADQAVDALVWSVATGAPVLALLAYAVKRRLGWGSPSAGAERRTVPR